MFLLLCNNSCFFVIQEWILQIQQMQEMKEPSQKSRSRPLSGIGVSGLHDVDAGQENFVENQVSQLSGRMDRLLNDVNRQFEDLRKQLGVAPLKVNLITNGNARSRTQSSGSDIESLILCDHDGSDHDVKTGSSTSNATSPGGILRKSTTASAITATADYSTKKRSSFSEPPVSAIFSLLEEVAINNEKLKKKDDDYNSDSSRSSEDSRCTQPDEDGDCLCSHPDGKPPAPNTATPATSSATSLANDSNRSSPRAGNHGEVVDNIRNVYSHGKSLSNPIISESDEMKVFNVRKKPGAECKLMFSD
jgi:hypothetical protein